MSKLTHWKPLPASLRKPRYHCAASPSAPSSCALCGAVAAFWAVNPSSMRLYSVAMGLCQRCSWFPQFGLRNRSTHGPDHPHNSVIRKGHRNGSHSLMFLCPLCSYVRDTLSLLKCGHWKMVERRLKTEALNVITCPEACLFTKLSCYIRSKQW